MKYLILLFCSITIESFSQSYEGYIGDFPVWFDLDKPTENSQLEGTYFYKKQFKDIELKGNKTGKQINLSEFNNNGKTTGLISLTVKNDSLIGKWENPKKSIKYTVVLCKTDSKYRPCEKLSYGEISVDSSDGILMGRSGVDLIFTAKNIVTYREWTEYYGAYLDTESEYRTFYYDSLCNQQGIDIWSEIDSSKMSVFREFVDNKLQACMKETRSKETDSAWISILENTGNGGDSLDKIFNWTKDKWNQVRGIQYFDSDGFHYYLYDYFHFPHVIQALDFSCGIDIYYQDLKKYLKTDSVLLRLIKNK